MPDPFNETHPSPHGDKAGTRFVRRACKTAQVPA